METLKVPLVQKITNSLSQNDVDSKESFYYEPENFKVPQAIIDEKQKRRVTISDDAESVSNDKKAPKEKSDYKCITNSNYRSQRRTRYSMFTSGIEQFDPHQELTAMQIAAFRQVFDMVDKDGGGSIDAEELYNSMKDLESNLNLDEIKDILAELDRDGNGEIDFEEFLYMMTSMSIQVKEAQEEQMPAQARDKRRQSIFFSVITKFAMNHSLKEIERYYASKTRYTPHVVGHYAAGACVGGLSEKELRRTWKEFSLANKGQHSPYAQPLNFVIASDHSENRRKKATKNGSKDESSPTRPSTSSSQCFDTSIRCPSTESEPEAARPWSRSLRTKSASQSSSPKAKSPCQSTSRPESRIGWTPRHRLPITKSGLPVVAYDRKKKLTIEDMSEIRDKVNRAYRKYYNRLVNEKEINATEYWHALKVEEIPSTRLQNNFKKVFRAYSPTNEYESALNQLKSKPRSKPIMKKARAKSSPAVLISDEKVKVTETL